jgi:cytochrome c-type biogenesis protein CcmH/NrfG
VLLSQARSAMGAGRYEDARIAYRKILQLQPENQEAKDGLHRIDLIRQNNNQ